MDSSATQSLLDQIGQTAGAVWRTLDANGAMSAAKLARQLGEPRDLVMQSIGWLAREGKVDVLETKRGRVIQLK